MKATETLNQVKDLLGLSADKKIELATMALENGTTLEAESFAEGQEVFIITDDERVALPVGDYLLENGQTLLVEEEGVIASIGEAQQEEEAAEEELQEEEMAYATKEELAEVKSMIEEIKAMIEGKEEMSEEVAEEEVKEELAEVEVQAEELSSQEEPQKVTHSPEVQLEKDFKPFAQKRATTTLDRVFNKMYNK